MHTTLFNMPSATCVELASIYILVHSHCFSAVAANWLIVDSSNFNQKCVVFFSTGDVDVFDKKGMVSK